MKAIAAWIVCIAAAVVMQLYIQSNFSLAVLLLIALTPIISLALSKIAADGMEPDLRAKDTAVKNETSIMAVNVRSKSKLPVLHAAFTLTVENLLTGECAKIPLQISTAGRRNTVLTLGINSRHCGMLLAEVSDIVVSDAFGIFKVRVKSGARAQICVMPDTIQPHITLPVRTNLTADSDVYVNNKPGFDYSETFQIREYAEGDSPKQIHWKLSAKVDKLIVRDPSLPVERRIVLFWDRTACGDPNGAACEDAMMEALVSVCRELNRQDVPCEIVWNDAEINGCNLLEIKEQPDLYELLPKLLSSKNEGGAVPLAEAYLSVYGRLRGTKVIYVTPGDVPLDNLCDTNDLTVLLCGECDPDTDAALYRFTPENYTEALRELCLT